MAGSLTRACFAPLLVSLALACAPRMDPIYVSHVDRAVQGRSRFPTAAAPQRVGTYPGLTKSGAGYFYDDVLEYRVWLHHERGARDLADGDDYYAAFATYEAAAAFAKRTPGAEEPLALVRQREWIDEPKPGSFVGKRGTRLTEWKAEWLPGAKREPTSVERFLRNPPRPKDEPNGV